MLDWDRSNPIPSVYKQETNPERSRGLQKEGHTVQSRQRGKGNQSPTPYGAPIHCVSSVFSFPSHRLNSSSWVFPFSFGSYEARVSREGSASRNHFVRVTTVGTEAG